MRFLRRRPKIPPGLLRPRPPGKDLLRAVAVTTTFGDRTVLNGIDLAVRKGEIFVILGPSGCGKTTLLRHLSGMLEPTLGSITFEGRNLYLMPECELDRIRQRTGFSFQGGALLTSMSVLDNVILPLLENTDISPEIARQVGRMKLDMVGLLKAAEASPADLSGGMKKRAAIARAVSMDPELVFFDEPSAGLDPVTAAEVDNLILKLNKVFGITMVVVTHDIPSAFTIADRMMILHEGLVLAHGQRDEVRNSEDSTVQDFIHRALPAEEARRGEIMKYLAT